jgi:hypothetical protein
MPFGIRTAGPTKTKTNETKISFSKENKNKKKDDGGNVVKSPIQRTVGRWP